MLWLIFLFGTIYAITWTIGQIILILEWKNESIKRKLTKDYLITINGLVKFYTHDKKGKKIRRPKPFIIDDETDTRYELPKTINDGEINIVEEFAHQNVQIVAWRLSTKYINNKVYHKIYIKNIKRVK